ncbi:MAG: hypothetical protein AB7P23_09685 [Amphiplicatus sp.]
MTFERNPPIPGQEGRESDPFHRQEPRPSPERRFASLTAGLLARKGEAEPAIDAFKHARVDPTSARQMAPGARHVIDRQPAGEGHAGEIEPIADAGEAREEWRRIRPAKTAASAARPLPEDAPRMPPKMAPGPADEDFADNCPRRKIAASAKRAAVTFRMSVHDFLRLKLASAELETPSQEIIIDAVEAYLDEKGVERLDECVCLAKTAEACGGDEED